MSKLSEQEQTIQTLRDLVAVQDGTIRNLEAESLLWQRIIMEIHQAFSVEKDTQRTQQILDAFMAEFDTRHGLDEVDIADKPFPGDGAPSC